MLSSTVDALLASFDTIEGGLEVSAPKLSISGDLLTRLSIGSPTMAAGVGLQLDVQSLAFTTVTLRDLHRAVTAGNMYITAGSQSCLSDLHVGHGFWFALPESSNAHMTFNFSGPCDCPLFDSAEIGCSNVCADCGRVCTVDDIQKQLLQSQPLDTRCQYLDGSLDLGSLDVPESHLNSVLSTLEVISETLILRDNEYIVSLRCLSSLNQVEQIVIVNNSNLLDARLPSLRPGVDIVVVDNPMLCLDGWPYGTRPCRGKVRVSTQLELNGLEPQSIDFLETVEGRALLTSLIDQLLDQDSTNSTLPVQQPSLRRRRSSDLELEFEFIVSSDASANLTFALDEFDIEAYRSLLINANVSVMAAAVVLPYNERIRREDHPSLEQLKTVATSVSGHAEGLLVTWDPHKLTIGA
jgi:hypothetical protein